MKKMGLLALAWLVVAPTVALAQQNRQLYSFKVGSYEVVLLSESQGQASSNILIGATERMLEEFAPYGIPNAMNAFLVRTPERNILFDTGLGNKLFDLLEQVGTPPSDIQAIFLTHMHGDHIGGLVKDDRIMFPNAKLFIPRPEHDYWMSDEQMNALSEDKRGGFAGARRVIALYADQLELIDPQQLEAMEQAPDGVLPLLAPGHTPGHTVYLLKDGADHLLIWGDLTHAMVLQMPYPKVAVTYDVDPDLAVISREKVLEMVTRLTIPIAGMHIAYPGIGKVEESVTETAYRYTPATLW